MKFECPNCHAPIELSFLQAMFTVRTKIPLVPPKYYIRCTTCGKRSWMDRTDL